MKDLTHAELKPRIMDEYDVAALMINDNIKLVHWRKIVQAVKFLKQCVHLNRSGDSLVKDLTMCFKNKFVPYQKKVDEPQKTL